MGWIADRLDAGVGDTVEAVVRAHHRRRLRGLGRSQALHPPPGSLWCSGEPPPRPDCRLEALIDGEQAFAAMAEALAGARRSVHLTGWHLAADFELVRGPAPTVLGELLAELAERVDVRVLVWAGAPFPAFHPTRAEVREAVQRLTRRTAIHCQADPHERPLHCHHEKTIVVDGRVAFVGGLDITSLAGDRWDRPAHPARRRLGWHDVGTRLEGPAVADVDAHFRMRWEEAAGERLEASPAPEPGGGHTVQVVRTVCEGMYRHLPRGEFRILEAYERAIAAAERFIYLESQFLWGPELVDALGARLRNPPGEKFRVLVVLPARANNGQDTTRGALGLLSQADGGAGRLLACTLRSRTGERDDPLYVHAKVGIVDDRWLTVGSANLNGHSMFNDTEMNVICDDETLVRQTRLRLWAEHLELDPAEIDGSDPATVIDERWRPIAEEQLARRRRGAPASHRLLAMPGVSRRSSRLLGPLMGLLDDG